MKRYEGETWKVKNLKNPIILNPKKNNNSKTQKDADSLLMVLIEE